MINSIKARVLGVSLAGLMRRWKLGENSRLRDLGKWITFRSFTNFFSLSFCLLMSLKSSYNICASRVFYIFMTFFPSVHSISPFSLFYFPFSKAVNPQTAQKTFQITCFWCFPRRPLEPCSWRLQARGKRVELGGSVAEDFNECNVCINALVSFHMQNIAANQQTRILKLSFWSFPF